MYVHLIIVMPEAQQNLPVVFFLLNWLSNISAILTMFSDTVLYAWPRLNVFSRFLKSERSDWSTAVLVWSRIISLLYLHMDVLFSIFPSISGSDCASRLILEQLYVVYSPSADPNLLQDERLKAANSAHQWRICRSSLTPSSSNASHPFLLPFVIRVRLLFIRPLLLFSPVSGSDESGDLLLGNYRNINAVGKRRTIKHWHTSVIQTDVKTLSFDKRTIYLASGLLELTEIKTIKQYLLLEIK